jgi:hypothetical protein
MNFAILESLRDEYQRDFSYLSRIDIYQRFREYSPILAQKNVFFHLEKDSFELYVNFLEHLRALSYSSIGLGIALGLMPEINFCGNILYLAQKKDSFHELISGSKIFSFAASEKGWKGRIKNIRTNLLSIDGNFLLNGEKGFATNGRCPDYFIVLAQYPPNFSAILLPADSPGLEIRPFDLSYAKEATHSELTFNNIFLKSEQILDFDYKMHGKSLQYLEIFSLQMILLGFLDMIKKQESLSSKLQNSILEFEFNIDKVLEKVQYEGRFSLNLNDISLGLNVVNYLYAEMDSILTTNYSNWELFKILLLTTNKNS